jgi:hypothetical protein
VFLQVQQPKVTSVLTEPQRALISTISEGQKAVQQAEQILETKLEVPDLGNDPVSDLTSIALLTKLYVIVMIIALNTLLRPQSN